MYSTLQIFLEYIKPNVFVAIVPFLVGKTISIELIINALTYLIGFETWNQFNSEVEDKLNGKNRPEVSTTLKLIIWAICVAISHPIVKIWLLLCPFVYLSGNNTPFKEMLMFYGIFVHYSYLKLPINLITFLRHAVTGCIQDLRDVEGDAAIGRITIPMFFSRNNYGNFYMILACFFYLISDVPLHSMIVYTILSVIAPSRPKFSYKLWQVNYVLELALSCWR